MTLLGTPALFTPARQVFVPHVYYRLRQDLAKLHPTIVVSGQLDERLDGGRIRELVEQRMQDMQPEDYLLLEGHPIVIAECLAYAIRSFNSVYCLVPSPLYGGFMEYIL